MNHHHGAELKPKADVLTVLHEDKKVGKDEE